jgi:hypothetical protein
VSGLLLLATAAGSAPTLASGEPFDGRRAAETVAEISADTFAGRKSGEAGGRRIEEYVARRFAESGLVAAGEGGGYFHTFPLLLTRERRAEVTLLDSPYGPVEFLYGDDYALITNSGSGDVTAEVVLVGHGLADSARAWDDYGQIDVAGKIVVIFRGSPENGFDWDRATSRDSTLHEAARRGAVGVIFHRGPAAVHGAAIHEGSYFPEIPIIQAGGRLIAHLLQNSGYNEERYREELEEAPLPLATGKRLRMRIEVSPIPAATARNVLGLLPGTDPLLARELIVVGAHMDHLGTDTRGLVYNGADDNASGTAVLIELARTLGAWQPRPARSILFAAFGGEEQGLLGSEALVAQSPTPLDDAVLMVNFDMVGQGEERVGIGGGEYYPQIWRAFRAGLDSTRAAALEHGRAWGRDASDHGPFREAGIPVCNIWSEGDSHFYHSIEDDVDWISADVLAAVGTMATDWIAHVAAWPAPLAHPRRAGRALLYGGLQIDFEGLLDPPPGWLHGRVHWLDAGRFGRGEAIDDVCARRAALAAGDSATIGRSVATFPEAAWEAPLVELLGIRGDRGERVPERYLSLLGDLSVGLIDLTRARAGELESGHLADLAQEGVACLLPADTALAARIPDRMVRYVRFFPGRGERIADPSGYPRGEALFIMTLEGEIPVATAAEAIRQLGWDWIHLDLVPWLAVSGEEEVCAFLERLQEATGLETRRMRALLGRNLER